MEEVGHGGNSVPPSTCQSGYQAEYDLNYSGYGFQCMDWSVGDGLQMSQETSVQENYIGGNSWRSMYWCQSNCLGGYKKYNLHTSCTNKQGCLPTQNPNGCFAQRQWDGVGYNGFDIWDKRSTPC